MAPWDPPLDPPLLTILKQNIIAKIVCYTVAVSEFIYMMLKPVIMLPA